MSKNLKDHLKMIDFCESEGDYAARNMFVIFAVAEALNAIGIDDEPVAGFAYDPNPDQAMDSFRVIAYIQLPEIGQVSWHLAEYPTPWDGHSTEEKYDRVRRFIGDES